MTFGTRIALAMTGTVLVAMVVVSIAGGTRVRRSYLDALRGSLEARIDSVEQQQHQRADRAREELERLVRSPRLVATVLAGDGGDLVQTAADELRGAMERAGQGAGFVFAGEGGELARSPGLDEQVASAALATARAAARGTSEPGVAYAVAGGVPYEFVVAPIVDRAEDSTVGALALCGRVHFPEPMQLPDGAVLETGMLVGGVLHGVTLDPDARRAVETTLGADSGATEAMVGGAEPGLAIRRPLASAGASLVVVAGLGPMRRAESALVMTGVLASLVALGIGIVFSIVLARGLSRPVAALGKAAARIETGDYAVRVADQGRDELATLGRRFNAMAEGLAQRERYRRVLDAVTDPEVAAELISGRLDLGGAEQDVGILFCDVRGFTSLTEGMPPHGVIELLNGHMTLLTEVAYRHGGTVDKFVGDLIMVTFGTPKTGPDDALRMARCARAMVDARAEANRSAKVPVEIGVGCAYGKVVAGCMGSAKRLDYTVLGERVNLASRLCSKAPAMHVYVDAATHAAIAGRARLRPLEPIAAKGFSRPVEAHELLSMEDHA